MADNYLKPVHNHFDFNNGDDLEDVDDDLFLNNSRTNSTISGRGSAVGGGLGGHSTNPFDDPHQIYAEKRRQIENRSLESTQKSLGLLYETEEVGKATAIELAKQREQLENTSHQLDDINSTLRFSQRHLNGLKSVFGGLKNYLSGVRDPQTQQQQRMPNSVSSGDIHQNASPTTATFNSTNNSNTAGSATSPTERYDNHPLSRLRGDSSAQYQRQQLQQQRGSNPFETQLDSNLEEMCGNLSRLKSLAIDLGGEIESQNDLLDKMTNQIEDVDLKMTKQNKEINRLLKK